MQNLIECPNFDVKFNFLNEEQKSVDEKGKLKEQAHFGSF